MQLNPSPTGIDIALPARPRSCDGPEGVFVYLNVRVPLALHEVAARHHHHLSALFATLREAGVDAQSIRRSLDLLVSRYREELIAAVADLSLETLNG